MNIDIKILRKGDSVLNVFNYMNSVAVSVKRKNGHIDIFLLNENNEGIPEIASIWKISEGDNEIEVSKGDMKISTF
ncbi:hypothetical protein [Thiothrix unzii]|uniref:Uncharacterized protein n=1 Tax=Thiothrix unzii TaxID=111769 RepID=A0A975IHA0_9GAMM|nr:hypothetical protein [Thiothrix unzii]QTR53707.1 hypothetical protein J9260_01035 [Thiothrix unzii]